MAKDEFQKRIESEQTCMRRITNDDLVCKDCKFKYDDAVILGNTSKCAIYESKPNKVILGKECDEYMKE